MVGDKISLYINDGTGFSNTDDLYIITSPLEDGVTVEDSTEFNNINELQICLSYTPTALDTDTKMFTVPATEEPINNGVNVYQPVTKSQNIIVATLPVGSTSLTIDDSTGFSANDELQICNISVIPTGLEKIFSKFEFTLKENMSKSIKNGVVVTQEYGGQTYNTTTDTIFKCTPKTWNKNTKVFEMLDDISSDVKVGDIIFQPGGVGCSKHR